MPHASRSYVKLINYPLPIDIFLPVQYKPEILASSIVAIGDFNPAIFSPDWLERNQLIGKDDASTAREGAQFVVTHQVTAFETDSFALQVIENQLTLTSKGVLTPALQDLAVSIFELVPHTPVTALGLNFMAHYKLGSEDEYHKVGDVLAPKEIWTELCGDEEHTAGLANLTIRIQQGVRGGMAKSGNARNISLQPSGKFKTGLFLSYNDHHDLRAGAEQDRSSAETAAAIIEDNWSKCWEDAERIFSGLIEKALKTG